jgi:hypothetical protein
MLLELCELYLIIEYRVGGNLSHALRDNFILPVLVLRGFHELLDYSVNGAL